MVAGGRGKRIVRLDLGGTERERMRTRGGARARDRGSWRYNEHGKVAASTLSEREGPEGLAKEQCQHLTYV